MKRDIADVTTNVIERTHVLIIKFFILYKFYIKYNIKHKLYNQFC
jgi:hypothetical protein